MLQRIFQVKKLCEVVVKPTRLQKVPEARLTRDIEGLVSRRAVQKCDTLIFKLISSMPLVTMWKQSESLEQVITTRHSWYVFVFLTTLTYKFVTGRM